jgi:hypothetical protein
MKRRTVLQRMASAVAALPFLDIRLRAQPRELTPEAIALLHELGATVLPASLGAERIGAAVHRFVGWTREYREGVPLAHGYGHPRLRRTAPSPVPKYLEQLAALDHAARGRGGRFSSLDLEARRAILDEALTQARVDRLPPRPTGQHVVSDLAAHYFRSNEALDACYGAAIGRETCRPIAVTTKRPAPLAR